MLYVYGSFDKITCYYLANYLLNHARIETKIKSVIIPSIMISE